MAVPSPFPPSPRPKAVIRAEMLGRRRTHAAALARETRGALEAQLAERVLPHLAGAASIAAYAPLREEIDPGPTVAAYAAGGGAVALPWFAARDAVMLFRAGPAREPGPWGVLQPSGDSPVVAPEILLVPLVAADRACTRIGHGKGHYDRALAHLREAGAVRTIGLAWDFQILDEVIPADRWDIALDAVASPSHWIGGW